MELILNFAPFLWTFLQLGSIKSQQKSKYQLILSGLHLLNLILFFCICFSYLFMDMTFEGLTTAVVLLFLNFRTIVNYLILILNQEKIRIAAQKLQASFGIKDDENFGIFENPKLDYMNEVGFIRNSRTVYAFCYFWSVFTLNFMQLLAIIYDGLVYGMIVVLTVEFMKLKIEIFEMQKEVCYRKSPENLAKTSVTSKFKQKIIEITRKLSNNPKDKQQKLQAIKKSIRTQSYLQQSSTTSNQTNNKLPETQFHKIINKHSEILEIRDELEEIFSPAFLANIICGGFALCIEEFISFASDNNIQRISVAFTALSQLVTSFMQCYYCQQLKDASLSISDAIYDCKWEEIEDVKVKKHLLMILMRSQKSKTLTCWKFAENSFELFGSVRNFFEFFLGIF